MSPVATEPDFPWVENVLEFWFAMAPEAWFEKSPALDRECADRFGEVHAVVAALPVEDAVATARRALAAVIVLDQFSRNMFRDTAKAFAFDEQARAVADAALARGLDQGLSVHERLFLYLPFEHSERLADQDRSVSLFKALGDTSYLDYAIAHRDIIARFGRFPHRNSIVCRPSTAQETAFLQEPGSSF
jgi:uncharacterized protein (DUF924 family)